MLICAIISLRWHGEAGVFQENWRIFRLFLLFSYRLITASAFKRNAVVPHIRGYCTFFSLRLPLTLHLATPILTRLGLHRRKKAIYY